MDNKPALIFAVGVVGAIGLLAFHSNTQDGRITALQQQVQQLKHQQVQPSASTTSADSPAQVVQAYGNGVGQMDMGSRTCNAKNCGGIPLAVTDYGRAYEFWIQNGNAYELSDGGKMIGGSYCIDYDFTSNPDCFTNRGTLTLRLIGPNGPYGPSETLTPGLIKKLKELK
jgi:hypothetical protein